MGLVVPDGVLLLQRPRGLSLLKELWADNRWYRSHEGPFCWGSEVVAVGRVARRRGGRAPSSGRPGAPAPHIDLTGIHRSGQPAAQSSRSPVGIALGRPDAELESRLRDPQQRPPCHQIADKNLVHHGSFCRAQLHFGRVTGLIRMETIAIGRGRPWQQRSRSNAPLASPAHPLRTERARVLGHRATNLSDELIVWVFAHGPLQKLDATSGLGKFL
jgi:hypothetical protein